MRKVPVSSLEGVNIPVLEMEELKARLRAAEQNLLFLLVLILSLIYL